MKRILVLTSFIFILIFSYSVSAFASGWIAPGTGQHADLSTSTNKCKGCHAVHDAYPDSYRLLRNTSRTTECNICHINSGLTSKIVYDLDPTLVNAAHMVSAEDWSTYTKLAGRTVLEEGTPIPDSTASIPERGSESNKFNCYHCHSVHGAKTIASSSKILWKDPAKNSGTDATSIVSFCIDCHDKNPNITDASDVRPNKTSHPINADGDLEVYGETIKVAGAIADCFGCHSNTTADFPHTSIGIKLLSNSVDSQSKFDVSCNEACHGKVGISY